MNGDTKIGANVQCSCDLAYHIMGVEETAQNDTIEVTCEINGEWVQTDNLSCEGMAFKKF